MNSTKCNIIDIIDDIDTFSISLIGICMFIFILLCLSICCYKSSIKDIGVNTDIERREIKYIPVIPLDIYKFHHNNLYFNHNFKNQIYSQEII
jgi:hypothetical protein